MQRDKRDTIALLATQRHKRFAEECNLDLMDVLIELDGWEERGKAREAMVVRYYYVIGMTIAEVGKELQMPPTTAHRKLKASIGELRAKLQP